MVIPYVNYYGNKVSKRWDIVLRAADRAHVGFHLTDGHRTFAEQAKLRAAYEHYLKYGRPWAPLAAKPSHNAPHIRTGRHAHAIDVNSLDGGAGRLAAFLRKHGARPMFPVPGEPWHLELSGSDLARLARKLKPEPKPKGPKRGATHMGPRGVRFLIREEGVRRYAYNDSAGNATFGVGHLIHKGPVTQADRIKWGTVAKPKSMAFVLKVLRNDLKVYNAAVREATKGVKLYYHEFNACVSLCFNIGTAGFKSSSVSRWIRKRRGNWHFRKAGNAFLLWNKPSELLPRRRRERELFLHGKYK